MIDTILLAVVAVGVLAHVWLVTRPASDPEPVIINRQAPVADPAHDDLGALENDLRIEKLIQAVDPSWKLGDSRDHVHLIPGPDGHIAEARLR